MNELSPKGKKLAQFLKWGVGLIGAVIISPFVFLAVKGIVGLALAIALGFVITQSAPFFTMIVSNWVLKAIKWEAAANPIETLQNQYAERTAHLEEARNSITDFDTNVRSFEGKVKKLKITFPSDSADFDEQLSQMHELLSARKAALKDAEGALAVFNGEITKARAKWDVAMAAQGAFKSAGKAAESAMAMIKRETALDSVELALNRSFAQLSTIVAKESPRVSSKKIDQVDAQAIRGLQGVQP